jgi:FMN phosphatase YigB (HAD superfamily)
MRPTVLVLDWGGVLTPPFRACLTGWAQREAVDLDGFLAVVASHLGVAATVPAEQNPFQAVECGQLSVPEFELALAGLLPADRPVAADGLLGRMFADFTLVEPMVEVVRRAHAAGVPTALLSNSWGQPYPEAVLAELFDVTVFSCAAGVRKPDPAAYLLTARLLGAEPVQCLFVDDIRSNVAGAEAVGMTGLWHRDPAETIPAIADLLGLPGQPAR